MRSGRRIRAQHACVCGGEGASRLTDLEGGTRQEAAATGRMRCHSHHGTFTAPTFILILTCLPCSPQLPPPIQVHVLQCHQCGVGPGPGRGGGDRRQRRDWTNQQDGRHGERVWAALLCRRLWAGESLVQVYRGLEGPWPKDPVFQVMPLPHRPGNSRTLLPPSGRVRPQQPGPPARGAGALAGAAGAGDWTPGVPAGAAARRPGRLDSRAQCWQATDGADPASLCTVDGSVSFGLQEGDCDAPNKKPGPLDSAARVKPSVTKVTVL